MRLDLASHEPSSPPLVATVTCRRQPFLQHPSHGPAPPCVPCFHCPSTPAPPHHASSYCRPGPRPPPAHRAAAPCVGTRGFPIPHIDVSVSRAARAPRAPAASRGPDQQHSIRHATPRGGRDALSGDALPQKFQKFRSLALEPRTPLAREERPLLGRRGHGLGRETIAWEERPRPLLGRCDPCLGGARPRLRVASKGRHTPVGRRVKAFGEAGGNPSPSPVRFATRPFHGPSRPARPARSVAARTPLCAPHSLRAAFKVGCAATLRAGAPAARGARAHPSARARRRRSLAHSPILTPRPPSLAPLPHSIALC
jgi:hypothetical protein